MNVTVIVLPELEEAAVEAANASLAVRFGFGPEVDLGYLRGQRLLHALCPSLPAELVSAVLARLSGRACAPLVRNICNCTRLVSARCVLRGRPRW